MLKYLFLVLLLLIGQGTVAVSVEAKYLTVEERNRQAMEDMRKLAEEMKKMNEQRKNGTYVEEVIDYSQYSLVFDYKNVFGNLNIEMLPELYKERGREWQQEEQKKHRAFLEKTAFDYMVVPIQDFSKSQDETSRLLAAEFLAAQLSSLAGKRVVPPELLLRALGENKIIFDDTQIFDIAKTSSAKIVHLYLNQPSNIFQPPNTPVRNNLAVVVTDHTGKVLNQKIYELGEISPLETLEVKVQRVVEDIAGHVLGAESVSRKSSPTATGKIGEWSVKGSFDDMARHIQNPLKHAAYLQLLAMLTPKRFLSERNHLFERSILALKETAETDPYHRLLKARALYYLHRRPQAMTLLKEETQPELVALREYLNGNYFALRDAVKGIDNSLCYVLSFLELYELSDAYGKKWPELAEGKIDNSWKQLIIRTTKSSDVWYSQEQRDLLPALEAIFPEFRDIEERFTADFSPANFQSDDDPEIVFTERAIAEMGERLLRPADLPYSTTINRTDFLRLIRNMFIDDIVTRLVRISYLQGRNESGVEFAEKRAALLNGLPIFTYWHAWSLLEQSEQKAEFQKHYFYRQVFDNACFVLENTNSYEAPYSSSAILIDTLRKKGYGSEFVCSQNMPTAQFPSSEKGDQYDATSLAQLVLDYEQKRVSDEHYQEVMATRYDGNPIKIIMTAKSSWKAGKRDEAIRSLKEFIKPEERSWIVYQTLGDYLLEQGDFIGASDAFFSYPLFLNVPSEERVGMSNLAYDVGDRFYRLGRYEESVPFFTFGVSLGTGSGAEMYSRYSLACIEKDYPSAAEAAYRNWQRYNTSGAYGKYALIESILGQQDDARTVLHSLLKSADARGSDRYQQLWLAFFVDERVQGNSIQQSCALAGNLASAGATKPATNRELSVNAFRLGFIDRKFDPAVLEILQGMAPVDHARPVKKGAGFAQAFPQYADAHPQETNTLQSKGVEPKQVPDWFSVAYGAMLHMQEGEHDKAVELFIDYDMSTPSKRLLIDRFDSKFVLTYALMAIMKSNYNAQEILTKIFQIRSEQNDAMADSSDDYLLDALFLATQGKTAQSIDSLNKSFWALNENDPVLNTYRIVYTAEWLGKYSGRHEYMQMALDWVKRLQVTAPYLAWPYAFEALYGTDSERRIESAAYAWYLDKNSYWLSQAPESVRSKGKARWHEIQSRLLNPKPETEVEPHTEMRM